MANRLGGVQGIKKDDKSVNNVYKKAYEIVKTSLWFSYRTNWWILKIKCWVNLM